jgi:hypothetical protein
MFTLKIITTDPTFMLWKSLPDKLQEIKETLETSKNSKWHISVEYRDLVPEVVNGYITHAWFDSIRDNLSDFVLLHMSEQQRLDFGIKPSLRGVRQNDKDDIGEMYVWAGERTRRGRYNQFVQTTLHEIRHEICRGTNTPDDTHELHGAGGDIRPHFAGFNMDAYRPRRQKFNKVLRSALIELIGRLTPKKNYPKYPDTLRPLVQRKADQLVAAFDAVGIPIRIVEGVRSCERQDKLYAQGRTEPGNIVTNARCGESLHQYGVAVDFVFRKEGYNATDAQWETLGRAGEALGLEWGGRWKSFPDKPHFQLRLGYKLKHFQRNEVDYSLYD